MRRVARRVEHEPQRGVQATMAQTAVFLQKACLQHRYIRSRDNSNIVERPERLRAVHVGLAAAVARLEEHAGPIANEDTALPIPPQQEEADDELTQALQKLQLSTPSRPSSLARVPVTFIHSGASVDLLNHAAVKFVHGDIERDVYLESLKRWVLESQDKVNKGGSEIPEGYSQGDLYRESSPWFTLCHVNMLCSMPRLVRCHPRSSWYCL